MARHLGDRVDNSNDTIDSRDVLERIEELEGQLSAVECSACGGSGTVAAPDADEGEEGEPLECAHCHGTGTVDLTAENGDFSAFSAEFDAVSEDFEELQRLRALVEEIDQHSGDRASDGACLIRESYFEDYARELASDIGAIKGDEEWPANCIDWERAARELAYDYSTITYDGVDYLVRS